MNFEKKVKNLLFDLLNNKNPKIKFVGKTNPNVIKQFVKTILKEKEFILTLVDYGREAPLSVRIHGQLRAEIQKFEKISGISWPLR